MNSNNNVAFLQNALKNLEDRYKKLQNRSESLQSENERLVTSRSELMQEVERLQEQQIRLRERNLRLTQEFHSKQQECSLLAEKLTSFARGRVGNPRSELDSFKSSLTEVKEDLEGSSDSLVTVELYGGSTSKSKVLDASNRTLSEPNLSVNLNAIQKELEKVRKGLCWSPQVENGKSDASSTKIISTLKKGESELEEQFSKMVEMQKNSLDVLLQASKIPEITDENELEDTDPINYIQHCTHSAVALHEKLKHQNYILKKLQTIFKTPPTVTETGTVTTSVLTQTSFNLHTPDSNTSVWKNMHTDRICPLCETVFSTVISQEEFENHVMEHFNRNEPLFQTDFEILAP